MRGMASSDAPPADDDQDLGAAPAAAAPAPPEAPAAPVVESPGPPAEGEERWIGDPYRYTTAVVEVKSGSGEATVGEFAGSIEKVTQGDKEIDFTAEEVEGTVGVTRLTVSGVTGSGEQELTLWIPADT